MSPVSSASGTKSAGISRPSWGWFQRTSASSPMRSPRAHVDDRLILEQQLALDLERALERACAARGGARSAPPSRARRPRPGPCRGTWPRTWPCRRRAASRPRSVGCRPPPARTARVAMPMLAVRVAVPTPSWNGSAKRGRMRSGDRSARARSASSRRNANSSPPRRQAVSSARSDAGEPLGRRGAAARHRPHGRACR